MIKLDTKEIFNRLVSPLLEQKLTVKIGYCECARFFATLIEMSCDTCKTTPQLFEVHNQQTLNEAIEKISPLVKNI